MAHLQTIMTRRRLLQLALAVSASLLVFFSGRAVYRFYRLKADADEPVGPWMSLGYAARAHRIDPQQLQQALGLAWSGKPERGPLAELAKRQGLQIDDFMKRVNNEVAKLEAIREAEPKPAAKP